MARPHGAKRATAAPVAVLFALLFRAGGAAAAEPAPITRNDYTLQFYQGPVTTATRIIGLAGAYAALAEYTEGVYANSAAPAVRVPWSSTRFDYDIGLSLTLPGTFQNIDFENRGRVSRTNRFTNSFNLGAGVEVQYGGFGATFLVDTAAFNLDKGAPTPFSSASGGSIGLHRGMVSLGYGFFKGQLLLGGGLRGAFLGVVEGALPNFAAFGLAPHVGAIWSPASMPLRVGVSYRDSVEVTDIRGTSVRADGAQIAQSRILPTRAVLPWELQFGVMVGLGGWPDNGERIDPDTDEAPVRHRYERARLVRLTVLEQRVRTALPFERAALRERLEREEAAVREEDEHRMNGELLLLEERRARRWQSWSRRGAMVVADILVTGSSPNSIGLEDFIDQQRVPFGDAVTVSPRAGVETEVWPNWVKARTGTYVEPSRFHDGYPRAHFTGGLDFRMFVFNPWGLLSKAPLRLRLAGDVAPRYSNFGVAIGTWH
jgi:hypothetical protein